MEGHKGEVWSAAFSPDGERIATGSADETVRLWDAEEGSKLLVHYEEGVWTAAFSPNLEKVVTASNDGTARLWDTQGQELQVLEGHEDDVLDAAFSQDDERIVTASADGTARLWPVEDLDQLLARSCHWLRFYLATHPEENRDDDGNPLCPSSEQSVRRAQPLRPGGLGAALEAMNLLWIDDSPEAP